MKVSVSTNLDDEVAARVRRVATEQATSDAAVIRRCVLRALPDLELEVLGNGVVKGLEALPEPAVKEASAA